MYKNNLCYIEKELLISVLEEKIKNKESELRVNNTFGNKKYVTDIKIEINRLKNLVKKVKML